MKKALLLSVVASTMIMAGGDIAPVEPVVVEEVVSGWDFSGQAVLYYQTRDVWGDGSLFEQRSVSDIEGAGRVGNSIASAGIQVGAVNKDIFAGIGAGFEMSGISDLYLANEVVNGLTQNAGNTVNPQGSVFYDDFNVNSAAAITQAYLTYGIGNTSIKGGRQLLPKALSPFAFSEGWNVFKNTFDAALIVNTDLPDTTLVGAYVSQANSTLGDLNDFTDISALGGIVHAEDGVWMLTLANKSIENLTLTGTWYYASGAINPDPILGTTLGSEDANILWGDAKYNFGENMYGLVLGVQGGTVMGADDLGVDGIDDTTAWGAKIGGNFDMFSASVAYSSVDDGAANIENLGTNVKTPLYTQMIFNQNTIKRDSDTIVARAGMKALGGKFGIAYNYSDLGATALPAVTNSRPGAGEYSELDVTYKVKVLDGSTTLFAGYVFQNDSRDAVLAADGTVLLESTDVDQNMLRFWARYNF